jgi:pimeloyl-ACP methyl ester carboxylesterase
MPISKPSHQPEIETGLFATVQPGITLHYAQCTAHDDAPTVLMLHGFPEFWQAWKEVMPLVAQHGFRVVAPDLRGYNLSSKPTGVEHYRASALLGDLKGLIAHLVGPSGRVHLVAHDWGGAIGWGLASLAPGFIERLFIINSPHAVPFRNALANDPDQQRASAYMNWLRRAGSEGPLAENRFARLDSFFLNMGGATWFHGATRDAYHAAWGQEGALQAMVNWYRASPLYPPEGDDPGAARVVLDESQFMVRRPTKVLWAQDDIALLPVLLEDLPRLVPDLEIERIAGATHWVAHEKPNHVAQAIAQFFAKR